MPRKRVLKQNSVSRDKTLNKPEILQQSTSRAKPQLQAGMAAAYLSENAPSESTARTPSAYTTLRTEASNKKKLAKFRSS